MPVYLVSDVDVPMPEEVSKFGDLDATREHRLGTETGDSKFNAIGSRGNTSEKF